MAGWPLTDDRARPGFSAPLLAFSVMAVLLVALAGVYIVLTRAPLGIGPASAGALDPSHVPPVGEVWFGTAVDARTFELTGRTDAVTTGSTVAMVAHLAAPVGSGQAEAQVVLGTTTMASNRLNLPGAGQGDVVAWTLAFPASGRYRVLVVDAVTGQTLASGEVTSR